MVGSPLVGFSSFVCTGHLHYVLPSAASFALRLPRDHRRGCHRAITGATGVSVAAHAARSSAASQPRRPRTSEMAPNIGVILGTMTFGWSYSSSSIDEKMAGQMLGSFFDAGFRDVDTALTYRWGVE